MANKRLLTLDEVIFQHVMFVLESCEWNVAECSRLLIVDDKTMRLWLKKWLRDGRIVRSEKIGWHKIYEPAPTKGAPKDHG